MFSLEGLSPSTLLSFTCGAPHLGTTTKAGSHANRNAGFIRQAGEWHWGCRMNPAFRWWCQDAPREADAETQQDGVLQ